MFTGSFCFLSPSYWKHHVPSRITSSSRSLLCFIHSFFCLTNKEIFPDKHTLRTPSKQINASNLITHITVTRSNKHGLMCVVTRCQNNSPSYQSDLHISDNVPIITLSKFMRYSFPLKTISGAELFQLSDC
jgi:hypothetical protein